MLKIMLTLASFTVLGAEENTQFQQAMEKQAQDLQNSIQSSVQSAVDAQMQAVDATKLQEQIQKQVMEQQNQMHQEISKEVQKQIEDGMKQSGAEQSGGDLSAYINETFQESMKAASGQEIKIKGFNPDSFSKEILNYVFKVMQSGLDQAKTITNDALASSFSQNAEFQKALKTHITQSTKAGLQAGNSEQVAKNGAVHFIQGPEFKASFQNFLQNQGSEASTGMSQMEE